MKKYIVCYTLDEPIKIEDRSGCVKHNYIDYYKVFAYGTSRSNKKDAEDFLNEIANKENLYTSSLCLIVKSTDY